MKVNILRSQFGRLVYSAASKQELETFAVYSKARPMADLLKEEETWMMSFKSCKWLVVSSCYLSNTALKSDK